MDGIYFGYRMQFWEQTHENQNQKYFIDPKGELGHYSCSYIKA